MRVRREQKPSLVPDGRADGVATVRGHRRVVVGDLETERRLPGGLQLGAAEHEGRRARL
jgi:hypothetical protein